MDDAHDIQRLAAAAAAGDIDAFEQLVRRERSRVFRVARRIVGDAEDAKDVAQVVFVKLWQALDRYDVEGSYDGWLYRITTNVALDFVRGRQRRREAGFDEAPPDAPRLRVAAAQPAESTERDVERIYRELLSDLPPRQRAAFALRELEGLTAAETARVLQTRESTVRNHLLQARRTLRRRLRERFPEYRPAGGRPAEGGEGGR